MATVKCLDCGAAIPDIPEYVAQYTSVRCAPCAEKIALGRPLTSIPSGSPKFGASGNDARVRAGHAGRAAASAEDRMVRSVMAGDGGGPPRWGMAGPSL